MHEPTGSASLLRLLVAFPGQHAPVTHGRSLADLLQVPGNAVFQLSIHTTSRLFDKKIGRADG